MFPKRPRNEKVPLGSVTGDPRFAEARKRGGHHKGDRPPAGPDKDLDPHSLVIRLRVMRRLGGLVPR